MQLRMNVNSDQALKWQVLHTVMRLQCGKQALPGSLLFLKHSLEQ